ncbi:unnamed protein product [Bubo scandiacus]
MQVYTVESSLTAGLDDSTSPPTQLTLHGSPEPKRYMIPEATVRIFKAVPLLDDMFFHLQELWMEYRVDVFGEVATSRMQRGQLGLVPWTSLKPCPIEGIRFSAQPKSTATEDNPAECCQEPSASPESHAPVALWDILSLASLFCACHRDDELQSQAEASSFGDASHHESPADEESGSATTQPQGTRGMMESHQSFTANLSTKWLLLQVGMEEDF